MDTPDPRRVGSARHPPRGHGGSINQKVAEWPDLVASLVDPAVPVRITVAAMPPVFGAVVEARKQTENGGETDFTALRTAFANSFAV